ncbi:PAS domain S-box protein [Desulfovibrio inopinatus]|uniref:PAS domain S-box protein n=1 Tax=Desulfovibrio inopinatus TaxID=102109 RepID=UPI00041CB7E2|nr:PAS domain S-box protein [Desulfovibrio inopinatus]
MTKDSTQLVDELHAVLGKMETALASIDEAIVWTDNSGTIQWCNAAFCRLLGQARIAILGKPVTDIARLRLNGVTLPDSAHPITRLLVDEQNLDAVYELFTTNGIVTVNLSATRFTNAKHEVSIVFVLRSMTDEAESSQIKLLGAALAASASAVVITTPDGNIEWINPAFTTLTGYEFYEVFGFNIKLLRSGKHDMAFYNAMYNTIYSGQVWRGELINKRKDGTIYHEEQTITPIVDDTGIITHFIAIKHDITERIETQKRIMETNVLLDGLRKSQDAYLASPGPEALFQKLSHILQAITGARFGIVGEVLYTRKNKPHLKTSALLHLRNTITASSPSLWRTQLRILFPRIRQAFTSKRAVFDNAPSPEAGLSNIVCLPILRQHRVIGLVCLAGVERNHAGTDIEDFLSPFLSTCAALFQSMENDRKRQHAERELAERETKFRKIFQYAGDGIILHTLDGTILDANETMLNMLGFNHAELRGKSVTSLHPVTMLEKAGRTVRDLQTHSSVSIEIDFIRQDGSTFPAEVRATRFNIGGKSQVLGVVRDMSEHHAAQAALQYAHDELHDYTERLNEDLLAAATIQRSFLPSSLPEIDFAHIAWRFEPSAHVGGDMFGVIKFSPDALGLFLLDVAGHGVPAALVAVSVAQLLNLHSGILIDKTQGYIIEPANVLEELDLLFPIERFGRHFTMFYGILYRNGQFISTNAGHPPGLVLSKNGHMQHLETGGTLVGMGGLFPFAQSTIQLTSGDKVILYSDGVIEREDNKTHLFGLENLKQFLSHCNELPLDQIPSSVYKNIMDYGQQTPLDDDFSLMIIHYTPHSLRGTTLKDPS